MGLETTTFKALVEAKARFRRDVKLTCFGYPDLLVDKVDLEAAGVKDFFNVKNEAEIAKWHSWEGPVYDTTKTLTQIGIFPTYFDVKSFRGEEIEIDLNTETVPYPADIILDPGTFEHVFNIGNAFKLVCNTLQIGGVVIHVNPITCMNHGFWNVCPTAYIDLYTQNGFEVQQIVGMAGPTKQRMVADINTTQRIMLKPEVMGLTVARRVSNVPFKWPVQTKYKAMING